MWNICLNKSVLNQTVWIFQTLEDQEWTRGCFLKQMRLQPAACLIQSTSSQQALISRWIGAHSLNAKHWYDKEKGGCLQYKHSEALALCYNSPSPCGRGCCSHCRTGTCTASSWSACSRPSSEHTGTCSEDMLREDERRVKTFQCNRNNWHRWKHTFKLCVWWGKLTDVQTEEPNTEMKLVVVVLGQVSG